MNSEKTISKLYRYEALLQAIDFFTQKFDLKQLANNAFDFANEILTLNSSALFLRDTSAFKLKKVRNYKISSHSIPDSPGLQRMPKFCGNVLTTNFTDYFDPKDIGLFDVKIVIPLIIQDLLYGFIISNGKAIDSFDEDDLIISKTIMQLINNALENSKNFLNLQETNKQLDQKIFNLFSINQSSRVLLSELELNKLYSLAIDIFSELTSSKITSFGLYDEIHDKILIKGYRNVFSSQKYYGEFKLFNNEYKHHKVVFDYKKDKAELKEIFINYEDFEKLECEYIILIVKKNIIGFVTISKPVNERSYDAALFELIESLAASTYISFTNAMYFEEITQQKNIIEQKLHKLTKLNSLIKNINSCVDTEELCDITIKTLYYGFGIKKAFIALHNNDNYYIQSHIGFTLENNKLNTNIKWDDLHSSSIFYHFTSELNSTYFEESLLEQIGDSNCLVISPIIAEPQDMTQPLSPLGYIVILKTSQSLKEDEILLIDTVTNSISPTINHMNRLLQIKKDYVINVSHTFANSINQKLYGRAIYYIDFYIYYKRILQHPFTEPDITAYKAFEHYYFDNILFVLSEIPLDEDLFDGSLEGNDLDEIIEKIKEL